VTLTANAEAVVQATRVVTLKGPKGDAVAFRATTIRNLPQVQVGVEGSVSYHESLALRLLKPGEGGGPDQKGAYPTGDEPER
jgi:hypothetical protein